MNVSLRLCRRCAYCHCILPDDDAIHCFRHPGHGILLGLIERPEPSPKEPAMPIPPPPQTPSIIDSIEHSARTMRALWEAVVKEKDELKAELASEKLLHRAEVTGMQGRIDEAVAERNQRPSWADHNKAVETLQRERDTLQVYLRKAHVALTRHGVEEQNGDGRVMTLSERIDRMAELRPTPGQPNEAIRKIKADLHDANAAASLVAQERDHLNQQYDQLHQPLTKISSMISCINS